MASHKPKSPHKAPNPVKNEPKQFFDLIVGNAIDFFDTSIKDFEKRPKYSVINFCSGLELILKARLLLEHWSMILKSPDKADLIKFQSGDFLSVTVVEIIDRLTKICNETFSPDETKCFGRLRDHRNKMVHFCHDAYSKKPDHKLLEEIAAEQCMAWCYLHRRLKGDWSKHFQKHRQAIEGINEALHAHRVFLNTKYSTLKPEIDKEISVGSEYRTCFACGFPAARVSEIQEPVHEAECRVCGTRGSFLRVACPTCSKLSDIDDVGSGSCEDETCGVEITLDDVMQEYVPPYDTKDENPASYYCAACEHPEQSATILGDRYFCFWCHEWFDCTEQCGFCGEHLVGFDPDESGFTGCFMCCIAAREHFDKD